jgi:hypothetical protein
MEERRVVDIECGRWQSCLCRDRDWTVAHTRSAVQEIKGMNGSINHFQKCD